MTAPREPCIHGCLAQRELADRQRERALGDRASVTGDVEAEVFVTLLIGAGFCFSQTEDYHTALEWAVRAYRAGLNGRTLADELQVVRTPVPESDH